MLSAASAVPWVPQFVYRAAHILLHVHSLLARWMTQCCSHAEVHLHVDGVQQSCYIGDESAQGVQMTRLGEALEGHAA